MSNLEDSIFDEPEPLPEPPVYLVGENGPETFESSPRLIEDEEDYT